MNSQRKSLLLFAASWLLLAACISQNSETSGYKVIFPLNEYLTTNDTTPYPVLMPEKFRHINTGSFINVMDYHAFGNGLSADDDAISNAFAACKDGSGVLFPKGKIFLIQHLIYIPLTKNITVYAYGAVFKMAPNTGYNAIAFEGSNNGYNNQLLWLGGLFDGNKNQQAWPGSPTGNNKWVVTQANYGLLTIRRAEFALVKDVSLINTVYDGIELFECKLGVLADSKAENGVPFQYSKVRTSFDKGRQSTYFKVTRKGSQTAYFINLICKGGSIGIHYSSKPVNDSSLAVITNCKLYNQAQDALHFELCRKIFINNVLISGDNYSFYHGDIHISNAAEIVSINNSSFTNGRVDFRNASALKIGVVQNCIFSSTQLPGDSALVNKFIQNATYVCNCKCKGKTQAEQVKTRYASKCDFADFGVALNGAEWANECTFRNGDMAIGNSRINTVLKKCTFLNVAYKPQRSLADKKDNENNTNKFMVDNITAVDEHGKILGRIFKY